MGVRMFQLIALGAVFAASFGVLILGARAAAVEEARRLAPDVEIGWLPSFRDRALLRRAERTLARSRLVR